MRAIDTNVLIRLITRDDPRQAAAADRFVEKGACVPTPALTEAMWVLDSVYELGPQSLAKAAEMLLSHMDLTLQDGDAVAAAVELFRARPALGFSDCLMVESATWISSEENRLTLRTTTWSPCSSHSRTEPGPMPSFFRTPTGTEICPCAVTFE